MNLINTNALIIGFGKAGKTLASYLAGQGMNVAIVEQSELMYGGTCINIGCIPTKAMVVSAENKMDYEIAVASKNELTTLLRKKNYDALADLPNVNVFTGKASFVNANEIEILLTDSTTVKIIAEKIFINTGTSPFIPAINGLQTSKRVFTSTTLLNSLPLPKKLTIIGGGFIGLEYASMYAQYGTKVTILDSSSVFLAKEDADMAAEIKKVLESKNITIVNGVEVTEIESSETEDLIYYHHKGVNEIMTADAILLATGRKAYTEGLNLAASGVSTNDRGFIITDHFLKTNVPHIWALGDINGGPQFTYISLDDFRIVKDQLFGTSKRTTVDRKNIPFSVFISPPFSHVGLREKEALEKGFAIKVVKVSAAAIPRTRIDKQTNGMLKAIIDEKTNLILGFTLFCGTSHEMINLVKMAMDNNITYKELTEGIYTHPSMMEAFNFFS